MVFILYPSTNILVIRQKVLAFQCVMLKFKEFLSAPALFLSFIVLFYVISFHFAPLSFVSIGLRFSFFPFFVFFSFVISYVFFIQCAVPYYVKTLINRVFKTCVTRNQMFEIWLTGV